jgi:hypothetical protein
MTFLNTKASAPSTNQITSQKDHRPLNVKVDHLVVCMDYIWCVPLACVMCAQVPSFIIFLFFIFYNYLQQ